MRKPSALVIFLTVFIDLVGFGIVIPLLQIYGKAFQANRWELAAIMSIYSLMQLIFGPVLGRLSDRVGRRPVLLLSTATSAGSYAIFAWGSLLTGQRALLVILISRALAGMCGANITVAQAYIADITPKADRSKRMALIGIAFGLGFIFGRSSALVRKFFGLSGGLGRRRHLRGQLRSHLFHPGGKPPARIRSRSAHSLGPIASHTAPPQGWPADGRFFPGDLLLHLL